MLFYQQSLEVYFKDKCLKQAILQMLFLHGNKMWLFNHYIYFSSPSTHQQLLSYLLAFYLFYCCTMIKCQLQLNLF